MSEEKDVFETEEDELNQIEQNDQVEDEQPEQEEEPPTPAEIAFENGMLEEKSEDEIMLDMIGAGATFKTVKTIFNKCMVDSGYLNSRKEKTEIVDDTLQGMDLSTEEGFNAASTALLANLKGVNDRSVGASIRQYAKKNELDVYKKPKGSGAGRSGITSKYYEFLRDNSPVSKEQVAAWIEENGTDNTKRHANHYQGIAKLCSDIAKGEDSAKVDSAE